MEGIPAEGILVEGILAEDIPGEDNTLVEAELLYTHPEVVEEDNKREKVVVVVE